MQVNRLTAQMSQLRRQAAAQEQALAAETRRAERYAAQLKALGPRDPADKM